MPLNLYNSLLFVTISLLTFYNIKTMIISIYDKYTYSIVDLLHKNNVVIIAKEITKQSIDTAISKIHKYITPKDINTTIDPIVNLFIDSNGGDFLAGLDLILNMEILQTNKIKFYCYAKNAKSTAFVIFQYCDKRFVTSSSTLFQHNISISLTGTFEDFDAFYKQRFQVYNSLYNDVNRYISTKIELPYNNYLKKISNEWTIQGGNKILDYNLADEIVVIINSERAKFEFKYI